MVPILQYIDILLLMCITLVIAMSVAVSVRSADEIVHELDELAGDLGRSDAHVIRNAIGESLRVIYWLRSVLEMKRMRSSQAKRCGCACFTNRKPLQSIQIKSDENDRDHNTITPPPDVNRLKRGDRTCGRRNRTNNQ